MHTYHISRQVLGLAIISLVYLVFPSFAMSANSEKSGFCKVTKCRHANNEHNYRKCLASQYKI